MNKHDGVFNKCDICGKFIKYTDFDKDAIRIMTLPDSFHSVETWETVCPKCNKPNKNEST